jgi:sulfoxide reductase heme-binding subunit YedZ
MSARNRMRWVIKPLVWVACLYPLGVLLTWTLTDGLGANPIEKVTLWTGYTTLVLLVTTLAVTPLRRVTGWNQIVQLRRLVGLFAFFYACLHFSTYVVLDLFFDFSAVLDDIVERPYITVGFTAFVLLIPLAVTSTKGWIRRLGKRWQLLHRLVYVSAALGVLHYYWKVKADTREPLIFAAILAILLLARLPRVTALISRHARGRGRPAAREVLAAPVATLRAEGPGS